MSLTSPTPSPNGSVGGGGAFLLDAELGSEPCAVPGPHAVRGSARVAVRDQIPDGTGELEYELSIENKARTPLSQASLVLVGLDGRERETVLWSGEAFAKPRLRLRGIVALPQGLTTRHIAAALRERRGALAVRIADGSGSAAACGELRDEEQSSR